MVAVASFLSHNIFTGVYQMLILRDKYTNFSAYKHNTQFFFLFCFFKYDIVSSK